MLDILEVQIPLMQNQELQHMKRNKIKPLGKNPAMAARILSALRTLTRYCERGPPNPHVNPLLRAWAAPPACRLEGLRAE